MHPDPYAGYRRQPDEHFAGSTPSAPGPYSGPATTSVNEYRNITLLPGEESVFAADFTPSPLLRHIKTGLVVTRDRVIARYPQYMFLVIKVGYAESSVPITQVCEVTTGRVLSQRRVRAAMIAAFLAFFVLLSSVSLGPIAIIGFLVALVLLAFAAFQAWLARGLALTVTHPGGGSIRVDVDKLEFDDMLMAGSVIHGLVLRREGSPPAVRHSVQSSGPIRPTPPPVAPTPRIPTPSAPPPPPTIWRG